MTVFVDTSALFAYLDTEDAKNKAAVQTFESLLRDEPLVTHNYVVVESAAVAHRRLGPSAARALLENLLPLLAIIWVTQDVHAAAVSAFLVSVRRRISLVDMVSFEVMRRGGIRTAFAFDRDFAAQGFEVRP